MTNTFNPFKPNSPIFRWMFTWRANEIENIDQALFQTRNWNPNNILLIWERWIWKTSLLSLSKHFAEWEINYWSDQYNFLTVNIILTENTTLVDLAKSINKSIERQFKKINPELNWIKQIWWFLSRLQVAGVSLKDNSSQLITNEEFIDDFIYSLIDTIKSITEDNSYIELWLKEKKDGIVLLIDEWDKACDNLHIWSFLKILSERLEMESANKMLVIMAWLPKTRNVLRKSHESSLRLFHEYILPPLNIEEVKYLVKKSIEDSNNKSSTTLKITEKACDLIYTYSEWYPHFVQHIWYSAFNANTDSKIDEDDVSDWFFAKYWALYQIGKIYYESVYNNITSAKQKQILWIMSEKWNTWTKLQFLKKKFKWNESTLNSGLKSLTERNIVLKNEKVKWEYRLQWWSFAFWINKKDQIKKT